MAYSSYLSSTISHTFPTILANDSDIFTTTLVGARMGDYVRVSCSINLNGLILQAYVGADDTITVTCHNVRGIMSSIGTGNIYLKLYKL